MAKLPLILVTPSTEAKGVEFGDTSLSLSENYCRSVRRGGGLPLVMPAVAESAVVAEYVRRCDGVLLTGGDDVNPDLYTTQLPSKVRRTVGPPDRPRDLAELLLIAEIFRQRKPLLAICRGHQLLNVALGGTLIADIPLQVPGAQKHNRPDKKNAVVHEVQLTPGSMLSKMVGKRSLGVNSSHHQAVGQVAGALQVSARSSDGVIEGLELADATALPYLVAVQFHPERLTDRHPEHLEIFRSFTRACARQFKDTL